MTRTDMKGELSDLFPALVIPRHTPSCIYVTVVLEQRELQPALLHEQLTPPHRGSLQAAPGDSVETQPASREGHQAVLPA